MKTMTKVAIGVGAAVVAGGGGTYAYWKLHGFSVSAAATPGHTYAIVMSSSSGSLAVTPSVATVQAALDAVAPGCTSVVSVSSQTPTAGANGAAGAQNIEIVVYLIKALPAGVTFNVGDQTALGSTITAIYDRGSGSAPVVATNGLGGIGAVGMFLPMNGLVRF
jgi:hypothetical protein